MRTNPTDGHPGPFATVDAETGQTVARNRTRFTETAFDRGDRYYQATGRDFRVLDGQGCPVPRPHGPLPSNELGGLAPKARFLRWRLGLPVLRLAS